MQSKATRTTPAPQTDINPLSGPASNAPTTPPLRRSWVAPAVKSGVPCMRCQSPRMLETSTASPIVMRGRSGPGRVTNISYAR